MDVRERAWVDALHGLGLQPDCRVHAEWSTPGGRDAAARLITQHPDATAVFVAADQQAVGLISGLYAAGVRIPDDLAIASFDGSLTARFTVPGLTTVGVPFDAMAKDAVAGCWGPRPNAGCTHQLDRPAIMRLCGRPRDVRSRRLGRVA